MDDRDDEVVEAEIVEETTIERRNTSGGSLRDYLRDPGPKQQWDVEVVQVFRVRADNEDQAAQVALLLSQGERVLAVTPVDEGATRRSAFMEGADDGC